MRAVRHLKMVGPTSEKCAVALPVRKPNAAYRSREHLTEREVERLIEAAKNAEACEDKRVQMETIERAYRNR